MFELEKPPETSKVALSFSSSPSGCTVVPAHAYNTQVLNTIKLLVACLQDLDLGITP
jgi:hypothetical protein